MTDSLGQPELQQRTLRLYGELVSRDESWGGKLLVAAFSGAGTTGFGAAASLAGGASLTIDDDAAAMKLHFRDGAFDFVVNTLDEALRALKNEVRQRRAIAIGLIAEPDSAMRQAAERGLAADLLLTPHERQTAAETAIGSRIASYISSVESDHFREWLRERRWTAAEMAAVRSPGSAALGELFRPDDPIRSTWLASLSTYQRSATKSERWCWLSPEERSAL